VLAVVGPTAVGKSAFALDACERFDGELVSVDSMQVYRGLEAATSKPRAEERARVPHHGLDLADPGRDFSMGDFVRAAERAIDGIRSRGRLPVLVGGTGLYLRGLLRGVAETPRRSPRLRARLTAIAERRGVPWLHRMLRRVDAASAARLPPRDRQRIARALEVYFTARRPLSALIAASPFGEDRYDPIKIGLAMRREDLHRRIDDRVDGFFAAGLVEEVRRLLAAGCPPAANAFKALGYREVIAHLRGETTLEEAKALTRRNTRRYAKRQWTWFRKEPGVVWFEVDPEAPDSFAQATEHAGRELARRRKGAWA
jgi:tRNA dimethylallyltransferase